MTLIVHKPDRFGVRFAAFATGSRDLDGRFVRDFFQICFSNRPRFLSEREAEGFTSNVVPTTRARNQRRQRFIESIRPPRSPFCILDFTF